MRVEKRPAIERDPIAIELGLVPPYEGYEHPIWKRSKRGGTMHHYDCPRAANGLAWFWPEGLGLKTEIDLLIEAPTWLHPCKVCFHRGNVDWFTLVRVLSGVL